MTLVSDWTQVGTDVFYRKAELYTLEWGGGLNVSDLVVCGAAYGGPIAITWSCNLHLTTAKSGLPMIVIFSAAGIKMGTIKWSSGGLIQLGWSQREELLCVQQDGAVSVYDMHATYKCTFNMGQEVKDTGVLSARLFSGQQGSGVAVLTNANRLHVVANIDDPHPRRYADLQVGPVLCWSVLQEERQLTVLLSQQSRGLSCVTPANTTQMKCPLSNGNGDDGGGGATTWWCMAVCSGNRSVALLSTTGMLWLGTADLTTHYTTYNTKSSVKPRQIAWCGSGSVVVMWEVTLQLITIIGSVTTFYLPCPAHLVQEVDCVRLIGDTKHDILYKIPQVSVDTLGIGSMSPGALLVEAHLGYEEESPRAYDCLTMIQGSEEEAVQQCLGAAAVELQPTNTKLLLKAALFGRTFLHHTDPDLIRTSSFKLRILNDLRNKKIGLPLTWAQLERLTVPVLLERLVERRLFPVALAIATAIPAPSDGGATEDCIPRILAHWAHYKMSHHTSTGQSDDQLAQELHAKLGYTRGISYTDIAATAARLGRPTLAVKLLSYECRSKEQVSGLLSLGDWSAALARAQRGGDTDLVMTVLLHVKRTLPLGDFLMLVSGSPLCRAVYARSCATGGRDSLRDLYVQEDNFQEQAYLRLEEAYSATRTDMRLGLLQSTAECFKRAKDDLDMQLTQDQIRLVKCQVSLEETHQKSYVDLSLTDTLTQLLRDNQTKEADKMRIDFKVPDKRYWHLRVCAHARSNHWQQLEAFSKSRKSPPIGFEAFVDECLKYGNQLEARKYVVRVKEDIRGDYLRKCGLNEEADKLSQQQTAPSSALARVMTAAPALQSLLFE